MKIHQLTARKFQLPPSYLVAAAALATAIAIPAAAAQAPNISSFCHGDGTAAACPCSNSGSAGRGCANSANSSGALLATTGSAYTDQDTLTLHVTGLPQTSTVFFRMSTGASNGGMGVPWNDGILCQSGNVVRLGTRTSLGGSCSFGYGVGSDPLVSVRGMVPSEGGTRVIQCLYRDPATYCSAFTMNTTNALNVDWMPTPPTYTPENLGAGIDGAKGLLYIDVDGGLVDSALLHGVKFNPSTNEWEIGPPILRFVNGYALNNTPVFQGFKMQFCQLLNDVEQVESSSVQASLSASIGLVKMAAALATSSQSGSSSLNTGFTLVIEPEYQAVLADLTNPNNFEFTPEALSILSLPMPARAAAWRDMFGPYIAIGYDYKGRVGAKVRLSQNSSFTDRSAFAKLEAKYKSVDAYGALSSLFQETLSSTNINIGYDTFGTQAPALPTLSQLSSPEGQAAFASTLFLKAVGADDIPNTDTNEAIEGAAAKRGLFLLPVTALQHAEIPDSLSPAFDEIVIGDATKKVKSALELIRRIETMQTTPGYLAFLNAQFPQAQGPSLGSQLQAARIALMQELQALWPAYRDYLAAETSNQNTLRAALLAAVSEVDEATLDLAALLESVDVLIRSLPPIYTTATETFNPNPSAPGSGSWQSFTVTVRNVAMFPTPGMLPADSAFQYIAQGDPQSPDASPVVLYFDVLGLWPQGQQPNTRLVAADAANLLGVSITTEATGPAAGLSTLTFSFQAQINNMTSSARLKFKDMLGRENTLNMHALDTAGWHSNDPANF